MKNSPPLLLVSVLGALIIGAVYFAVVLRDSAYLQPSPAREAEVERLSEISVTLSDEKRLSYEQQVIDLTVQIEQKSAAGEYVLDLYFLRGIAYERLGKLALAFGDLTIVTEGDPGNETAWNNLGEIVIDMGDVMAAEHYFEQAIEQDPSEVAYNKLYRYYTEYRLTDRSEKIEPLLKQAILDNPQSSSLNVKLGRWYLEQGNEQGAIAAFGQASVLSPGSSAIQEDLQKALAL